MPRHVVVFAAILNAAPHLRDQPGRAGGILWWSGVHVTIAADRVSRHAARPRALTLGVALFLAPLHVRYHDVGYLWGLAVQVGFWLTPIIYQEVMIPQRWQWLM